MKVLVLYEYPPNPSGLATQGDLLYRGLKQLGVDAYAVHYESNTEKEWYYHWFHPDIVVGIGYWGYLPHLVLHPQSFGFPTVPWLVADGFVANYRDILEKLPLVLVTSNWVKEVYMRDGISGENIHILPVGCDTDAFRPHSPDDPQIMAVRKAYKIHPEELMILTVGGDGASKGAQEVMQALSKIHGKVPQWKYVCKVWPQARTNQQNRLDMVIAESLDIQENVVYTTDIVSRNYMPFLMGACDIYAAPSRLEGFGMPQVEAGACGKPVIGIRAMAMLDTLIHGKTAFLAGVAKENLIQEAILGPESGYPAGYKMVFDPPRVADYRANVDDISQYLQLLMGDEQLRKRMGEEGRKRAVEAYDYRVVANKFLDYVQKCYGFQ
jgi:alpha-maltose-1-phosphate synthase